MHATICDVLADTVQNSIEAGATEVSVEITEALGKISVSIADNGKGMDEAILKRAFDPFYTEPGKHDARKVGLGLPILKQICDACGGFVTLESTLGVGTTLKYSFDAKSIDLPPWGDLPKTIVMLMNYPGEFELIFTHQREQESYTISRNELGEAVGGFDTIDGLTLATEFIRSSEESLS